jgi:tRNA threonylcarbamoyladenosine biosynthesis protein TsaB
MRVLALDTTTRVGSAALVDHDRVVLERPGDRARTHGERLPLELLQLLCDAGVRLSEIDVFAVAAGPGSFTGLRIGIATIQGLAFVERKRVVAVSALEATAQAASLELAADDLIGTWMDGERRDVFSALYRVTAAPFFTPERLAEIEPPSVGPPRATWERWADCVGRPVAVAGTGAMAYREWIAPPTRILAAASLAGTVGRMAVVRARRGDTIDPAGVQPLYVRRPDAEIARNSQAGKQEAH